MHDARVAVRLGSGAGAVALVGDIPPCVALTFRIVPPDGASFARTNGQRLGYTELTLEFLEEGRAWRLTKDGLQRLTGLPDRGRCRRYAKSVTRRRGRGAGDTRLAHAVARRAV